jgi:hypothetical protein
MGGGMGERGLALAAILLSLIGLAVLLLYARSIEPSHISITAIEGEPEGAYLEVLGRVSEASSRGGNVFIRLCDRACVDVFVPGSQTDLLDINPYLIRKGDRLLVRGTLEYYKGEPELVPLGSDGLELV